MYPVVRPRRLRRSPELRRLVQETRLSVDQFVYPVFVQAGIDELEPIPSMPGQNRWPVKLLPRLAQAVRSRGIPAIILFGLPSTKDERGSAAYQSDGIVQQAVRTFKDAAPELVVVTDTCLDEYTTHGHCGIVVNGEVDNDATLDVLAQIAVSQALSGADLVAPSDMMDGRVAAIRGALDGEGLHGTGIMAYSAKYASAFYGPFREAANCAPQFGDRRSYQMDPSNSREALREVDLDIAEGADIIMVKPALSYLDVVREVRSHVNVPVAAYNVSGEYSMVKAAADRGWVDARSITMEVLLSIARAGADFILTYHACEAAEWLQSAD